jgi:FMN reductase
MALVVAISGSPSHPSRSWQLTRHVGAQLASAGFTVESLNVRDLPAEDLLHGKLESPGLKQALGLLERAQGVVITTPVYKASFTGVLKSFLDLLPQFGLTGKVALPLATGGTLAHVLALDYGFRPVLASLGALHVVNGLFLLDKLLGKADDGALVIESELSQRLDGVIDEFARAVRRVHPALRSLDDTAGAPAETTQQQV